MLEVIGGIELIVTLFDMLDRITVYKDNFILNRKSGKGLLEMVAQIKIVLEPIRDKKQFITSGEDTCLKSLSTILESVAKYAEDFQKKTIHKRLKKIWNFFHINSTIIDFNNRLNFQLNILSLACTNNIKNNLNGIVYEVRDLSRDVNEHSRDTRKSLKVNAYILSEISNIIDDKSRISPQNSGSFDSQNIISRQSSYSSYQDFYLPGVENMFPDGSILFDIDHPELVDIKKFSYERELLTNNRESETSFNPSIGFFAQNDIANSQIKYENINIGCFFGKDSDGNSLFSAELLNCSNLRNASVYIKIIDTSSEQGQINFEKEVNNLICFSSLDKDNHYTEGFIGINTLHSNSSIIITRYEDVVILSTADLSKKTSSERIELVKSLAKALLFFHSKDFVHGNLVPDNILLRDNNTIILSGLSFARCIKEEQNKSVNFCVQKSADIYSVGLLLINISLGCFNRCAVDICNWVASKKKLLNILADNFYDGIARCLSEKSKDKFTAYSLFQWSLALNIRTAEENYLEGNLIYSQDRDYLLSAEYYKTAMQDGSLKAKTSLAMMYVSGKVGSSKDAVLGIALLKESAHDYSRAAVSLSETFGKGDATTNPYFDPLAAIKYAEIALKKKDSFINSQRPSLTRALASYKSFCLTEEDGCDGSSLLSHR